MLYTINVLQFSIHKHALVTSILHVCILPACTRDLYTACVYYLFTFTITFPITNQHDDVVIITAVKQIKVHIM